MLVTELTPAQIQHMAYMVALLAVVMGFAGHALAVLVLRLVDATARALKQRKLERDRAAWLDRAALRMDARRRANGG